MKRLHLLTVASALILGSSANAQAPATATRAADLQVGAGFTWAHSDYVPNNIGGFSFYGDYDFGGRFGVEADFHRVKDPHNDPLVHSNHFSETTYEIGGRYLIGHYYNSRLTPYGKVLYGRGVVNFPAHQIFLPAGVVTYIDNLGYNLVSFGGGADYELRSRINLRADFEYQRYFANDPELPNGLGPYMFTFGAAYHFPAHRAYKMVP